MRQVTDVREWQDHLFALMCSFGDFCDAHGLRYQLFVMDSGTTPQELLEKAGEIIRTE